MSTIVSDNCGNKATKPINTGGKKQCLPAPIQSYAVARGTFAFPDVATARTKTAWDAAKSAKDVVLFWDIEEFEQANTEPTKKEGRFADYPIKAGIRGQNVTHYLGDCSYEALKSYDQSNEYTKMFKILTDGTFTAVVNDDGTVSGEPIRNFSVGMLNDATDDTPQNAVVEIKFGNQTKSVLKPDFDIINYEGIYNVMLEQESATASKIEFFANSGCSGNAIIGLDEADFVLRDATGTVVAPTTFVADTNGLYTMTGTGFADGYTIELAGVIVQATIMYDAPFVLVISI